MMGNTDIDLNGTPTFFMFTGTVSHKAGGQNLYGHEETKERWSTEFLVGLEPKADE